MLVKGWPLTEDSCIVPLFVKNNPLTIMRKKIKSRPCARV